MYQNSADLIIRAKREIFSSPVTYLMFTANVVVWIGLETTGGSSNLDNIVRWGANYGPAIVNGEFWRLISATFIHIGFFHLLLNMAALIIFGREVEKIFGWKAFAICYLTAGVGGGIVSVYWQSFGTVSAGASGALFGLLGSFGSYILLNRKSLDAVFQRSIRFLGFILFVNIAISILIPAIDGAAHVGGLVVGMILGVLLAPQAIKHTYWVDPATYSGYTSLEFRRASFMKISLVTISSVVALTAAFFILLAIT